MMRCGVLVAGKGSAMTMDEWTTVDLPDQQVSVLDMLDAWLTLEQSRIERVKPAGSPHRKSDPVSSRLVNCLFKRDTIEQRDMGVGNDVAQHLHKQKQVGLASVVRAAMNEACNQPEKKGQ